MARYLLSSQSVLDICMRQGRPAERWLDGAPRRHVAIQDVCISAVTPMSVLRTIEDEMVRAKGGQGVTGRLHALGLLRQNALRFFEDLAAEDRIVAIDHHITQAWGLLLDDPITYVQPDGSTRSLGGAEKLEIATAVIGREGIPFVYLTDPQEAHQSIPTLITETP